RATEPRPVDCRTRGAAAVVTDAANEAARAALHVGKGWGEVGEHLELEEPRIEVDRGLDVVDHVADADGVIGGHGVDLLWLVVVVPNRSRRPMRVSNSLAVRPRRA